MISHALAYLIMGIIIIAIAIVAINYFIGKRKKLDEANKSQTHEDYSIKNELSFQRNGLDKLHKRRARLQKKLNCPQLAETSTNQTKNINDIRAGLSLIDKEIAHKSHSISLLNDKKYTTDADTSNNADNPPGDDMFIYD